MASAQIPQASYLWGTQRNVRWTQCGIENFFENFIFLRMATYVHRNIKSHKNVSTMSTKKTKIGQKTATATIANSRHSKYAYSCRSFWTNDRIRQEIKICFMHDRCFHKIRGCDHCTQQGSRNSITGNFWTLVLQIWTTCTNSHWWWKGILQQTGRSSLPSPQH